MGRVADEDGNDTDQRSGRREDQYDVFGSESTVPFRFASIACVRSCV
jgi:hypothetical protein